MGKFVPLEVGDIYKTNSNGDINVTIRDALYNYKVLPFPP